MNINRLLIDHINNEGQLQELAFFLHLKGLWSNSVITDYRQEKLGSLVKKGRGYGRARGEFILNNGWGRVNKCGHLLLKSVNNVKCFKKRIYVKISIKNKSVKEIYNLLVLQIIKHKIEQAEWYQKTCHDLRNFGGKELRVLKRRTFKKYENFRERDFSGAIGSRGFKISFSRLSKWFDCSVGKIYALIKDLEASGLIKIHSWYKRMKIDRPHFLRSLKEDKQFISKNKMVIRVACNQYTFL